MLTTAPRGTKDILPRDVEAWRYLERTMREICAQYGYLEIRTPVFEHTELFKMMPVCLRHFSRRRRPDSKHNVTLFHHLNIIKAGTA